MRHLDFNCNCRWFVTCIHLLDKYLFYCLNIVAKSEFGIIKLLCKQLNVIWGVLQDFSRVSKVLGPLLIKSHFLDNCIASLDFVNVYSLKLSIEDFVNIEDIVQSATYFFKLLCQVDSFTEIGRQVIIDSEEKRSSDNDKLAEELSVKFQAFCFTILCVFKRDVLIVFIDPFLYLIKNNYHLSIVKVIDKWNVLSKKDVPYLFCLLRIFLNKVFLTQAEDERIEHVPIHHHIGIKKK